MRRLPDLQQSARFTAGPAQSSTPSMALAGNSECREDTSISFPDWWEALQKLKAAAEVRQRFRFEIMAFLRYCRLTRTAALVGLAKQYIENLPSLRQSGARSALRWFATRGRVLQTAGIRSNIATGTANNIPPPAADDLGGADWERDLIAAIRRKGLLWRTEQTYRKWASRFARFLGNRSPYMAEGGDIANFLSSLAVEHRASASS